MSQASRRVPPAPISGNSSRSTTTSRPAALTSAGLPIIAASPWSSVAPVPSAPVAAMIAAPAGAFPARDPRAYAMELEGDCLAPDVRHGSVAIMSPAAALTRGGFVALYFRDGRAPQIKRLASLPPSPVLASLGRPGANVAGLVLVEALNPYKLISLRSTELLAVHAVVEIVRPEHVLARRSAAAPGIASGTAGAA